MHDEYSPPPLSEVAPNGHADAVPAWPGHHVDVDGLSLFTRHCPSLSQDPQQAVLLHGLGGGSAAWTDLMDQLRERMECHAPDMPGFGRSSPPPASSYGVDAQAEAVRALLRTIGEPVHLFGNSLGGAVAVRVAADDPERVRTLTLIAPTLPDWRLRRPLLEAPLPLVPGVGKLLTRRALRETSLQQAETVLRALAGDPASVPQRRITEAADEIDHLAQQPHAGEAYVRTLRGAVTAYLRRGPTGLWSAAGRIAAPTLAIYGGVDPLVGSSTASRLARVVPRAHVLILPGVGHLAHIERPEQIANAHANLLHARDLP